MNRLLLTAAAVASMAFSSHAMAVTTYQIDAFDDGLYLSTDLAETLTDGPYGDYGRQISFTVTEASPLLFGGVEFLNNTMTVANEPFVNSTVSLSYNIGTLTGLGSLASVDFGIISSDATSAAPITLKVFLDTAQIGSWSSTNQIAFGSPVQPAHFEFDATTLNGTSNTLRLELAGTAGWDYTISPLSVSSVAVSPVPEPGLLPMLGSGLLVVGLAARRRRAAMSA